MKNSYLLTVLTLIDTQIEKKIMLNQPGIRVAVAFLLGLC